MKDPEHKKRNLQVGFLLGIIFLGLFAVTTFGFVIDFEASPSIKKLVSVITTIIAGVIGICLVGAAVMEIIVKTRLVAFIVNLVKRGYRRVRG